jgi:hypothetical protein
MAGGCAQRRIRYADDEMTMRRSILAYLLLAAIPWSYASGSELPQPPEARTREFIDTHGQEIALQSIERIQHMHVFLSKNLLAALRAARISQEAFVIAHPGDKPGLVEIGFNSGEENEFDSYIISRTNMLANNRAIVYVSFVDSEQQATICWKDSYEWVFEGGAWRLDDIVYRGDEHPGSREHRLKTILRAY